MKRYTIIISCFFAVLLTLSSCDEDILNRMPLDEMNDQAFWTSLDNLELYSKQFYSNLPKYDTYDIGDHKDSHSDNVYAILDFSEILKGTRVVPPSPSEGGWDYSNIRDVNYFLDNYEKAGLDIELIKQQVGEVYFFRAYFYFNLVKRFGDVQWFDKVQDIDSEGIYKPRDPRHIVINHVIEDLDIAAEYLGSGKLAGGNQLSSEVALLFKSRVCLYEGTWEKYHA
ncbi:MAG: RagB/SusD family nutrient uptake outer membrane protein, partial [Bacteroidota bacterium]